MIIFTVNATITHMDWIGMGHKVGGLDWIRFKKLDPSSTLV